MSLIRIIRFFSAVSAVSAFKDKAKESRI